MPSRSLHEVTTQTPPIRGKDVLISNTFILMTLPLLVLMQSCLGAPLHTSSQASLKPYVSMILQLHLKYILHDYLWTYIYVSLDRTEHDALLKV